VMSLKTSKRTRIMLYKLGSCLYNGCHQVEEYSEMFRHYEAYAYNNEETSSGQALSMVREI